MKIAIDCDGATFEQIYTQTKTRRKKRGRPRMTEEFFYDPYTVMVDPDVKVIGQRRGIWVAH